MNRDNNLNKKYSIDFNNHPYFKEANIERNNKINWSQVKYCFNIHRNKIEKSPVFRYLISCLNKNDFPQIKKQLLKYGLENNIKIGKFHNLSFDKTYDILTKLIQSKYHASSKLKYFYINEIGMVGIYAYVDQLGKLVEVDITNKMKYEDILIDEKFFVKFELPNLPKQKVINSNPILKERATSHLANEKYNKQFLLPWLDKYKKYNNNNNNNNNAKVNQFIEKVKNNSFGDFEVDFDENIAEIIKKKFDSLTSLQVEYLMNFVEKIESNFITYKMILEVKNNNYNFEPYIKEFFKMDVYEIIKNHSTFFNEIYSKIKNGTYHVIEEELILNEEQIYIKYNNILDKVKSYGKESLSVNEINFLNVNSEVWLNFKK